MIDGISVSEELDFEALEYWFAEVLEKYYCGKELLDLLMVVTNNRENCLVAIYSEKYEEDLINFCEFYDLNYRVENTKTILDRVKDLFRRIRGEKTYTEQRIWISHKDLPKYTSNWSQKEIGHFLNYPESAVDAFLDDDRMSEKTSDYVSFRPAKSDINPLLTEEERRMKLLHKLDKEGLKFPSRWLKEFESYSNASS